MSRICYICDKRFIPEEDISLHRFPRKDPLLKIWKNVCNLTERDNVEKVYLCSQHFRKEYFSKTSDSKKRLKPNAVPEIALDGIIDGKFKVVNTSLSCSYKNNATRQTIITKNSFDTTATSRFFKENETIQKNNHVENEIIKFKEDEEVDSIINKFESKEFSIKLERLDDIFSENSNLKKELQCLKKQLNQVKEWSTALEVKHRKETQLLSEQLVKVQQLHNSLVIKYNNLQRSNQVLKNQFVKARELSRFLEAKNNSLFKENQSLKGETNKSEIIVGYNEREAECSKMIDLTDINSVCRICLQKNKMLVSVHNTIRSENNDFTEISILEAIETLVSEPVLVAENVPSQICLSCENQLKQFETLRSTYIKNASILQLYLDKDFRMACKKSVSDHNYSKNVYTNEEINFSSESENDDIKDDVESNIYVKEELLVPQINLTVQDKDVSTIIKRKSKVIHTCPICWIQLSISEFIPHVKTHKICKKYLSGPIVPKKCRFYAPPRKIEGFLSNDSEKNHTCPICKHEFKAKEFIMHVDNHLRNDQFTCKKCNRVFKKKSFLLSHMLVHNTDFPYRCKTCNKGFVVKDNYECHLLTHKDEEYPHKCKECEKRFSNPKHLARHMTIHTENRNYSTKYKYLRCKYCCQNFTNSGLPEHDCQQKRINSCKYCCKNFVTARAREVHMYSTHLKDKKKSSLCRICNISVYNIHYHKIKYHSNGKKKALCTVCGLYVFNIYNHMIKHKQNISGKFFKCPICSKQFAYRTVLKRHVMVHSGLKPYICSYCAKAFGSHYNLQVHERIHIGNRCHVCEICDKGFLEKSYLNKHMKTHKELNINPSEADNIIKCEID